MVVERAKNVSLAFLAQHQPLRCPWYIPNMAFCFSDADQSTIREALQSSTIPESSFWGSLVGHLHEWGWFDQVFTDGKGFNNFKQLETSACKGDKNTVDINGAIQIVPLSETGVNIAGIERRWYDSIVNKWFLEMGPPKTNYTREVYLHQKLVQEEFALY